MASQLTIRGVSPELGKRLTRLSRETGRSVNTTALSILEAAVGIDSRRLAIKRYATWTREDAVDFDKAIAGQRVIDHDLWS